MREDITKRSSKTLLLPAKRSRTLRIIPTLIILTTEAQHFVGLPSRLSFVSTSYRTRFVSNTISHCSRLSLCWVSACRGRSIRSVAISLIRTSFRFTIAPSKRFRRDLTQRVPGCSHAHKNNSGAFKAIICEVNFFFLLQLRS